MTMTTDADTAPSRRVAPALLGLSVVLQVLSNLVFPGLGIAFVALLWWRRARLTRPFVVVLIVVAVLSAAFLAVAVADVVWGPQVGYHFG
ncbi:MULTISPECIES: hypothetical protein [unclassified Curtobacterium]|uniref:hypothetical protein n=1 Tax=unclassified Curtobacterium TaxID=257496 RepID=UPI00226BAC0D|nr:MULTISPECIES: hypothetical protein [unclassified Curtobacterium]